MKIINFKQYLDGGTIEITTESEVFCFDDRIESQTKGSLYNGYPKDCNSNLIENSEELEMNLIESLKNYKDEFYQTSIDYLVKSKQKMNNELDITEDKMFNQMLLVRNNIGALKFCTNIDESNHKTIMESCDILTDMVFKYIEKLKQN